MIGWKRTKRGVQILFKFKKKQEKDKTKLRGQIIELLSIRILIIGVLLFNFLVSSADGVILTPYLSSFCFAYYSGCRTFSKL